MSLCRIASGVQLWEGKRSWVREVVVVLGASILIALCAPISIPLPFTPVPIATQAQVVLLLAVLLGSRRASLAVLTYLCQGACGLPVFAGGKMGLLHLAGPTGGYLLGYLVGAYLTGFIAERLQRRSPLHLFSAMAVGNGVIFLFGLLWLSRFMGFKAALFLGVLPFLLGDAIKLLLASRALRRCC